MASSSSSSLSLSYWIPLITVSTLLCLSLFLLGFVFSFPSSCYDDNIPFRYQYYNGNCLKQQCSNNNNNTEDTIVIIPGLDGATSFFSSIVPYLTKHHSVLVYSLPLFTSSMKEDDYNFEYLANQLKEIIDELNINAVHIVGESFGGVIGQHFAFLHSERTKSLSVLSSLAKTELTPFILWKLTYLVPILKHFGTFSPCLGQSIFARLHVDDVIEPSEGQYVRDLFIKEASAAHFKSVMHRIRIISKLDIEARTKTITSPSLIIYGRDDHFTKHSSIKLSKLINKSKLESLSGGHLCHVSFPADFASLVLDFISTVNDNRVIETNSVIVN